MGSTEWDPDQPGLLHRETLFQKMRQRKRERDRETERQRDRERKY